MKFRVVDKLFPWRFGIYNFSTSFLLIFRDSRPHSSNMMGDNSTRYETQFAHHSLLIELSDLLFHPSFSRYLEEMTLLLREEFPYSTVYPVLGDQDFNPPSQAKPQENMITHFYFWAYTEKSSESCFIHCNLQPFSRPKTLQINEISSC